jgi:hypothetical protein
MNTRREFFTLLGGADSITLPARPITRRNRPIRSVPRGGIARCNKSCNPPYHLGLSQQGRMTLIRHYDDFKLVASCQHLIQGGPGQHI